MHNEYIFLQTQISVLIIVNKYNNKDLLILIVLSQMKIGGRLDLHFFITLG